MDHLATLSAQVALNGIDVVDVGAGQGHFAAQMVAQGARVVGIEIDEGKLRAAQAANHGLDMRLGYGEALPLDDGSADLVCFIFSLHHVPPLSQPDALTEACRVLRPGGHVFVVEPDLTGAMTEIIAPVVASVILVDPDRARRFEEVEPEVQARFKRLAVSTDMGFQIEQPTTFHHFRNP